MAETIPASVHDLFEKPILAHLATIMSDGTPQVTPVWVDYDGNYILINTSQDRQKTLNMKRQPKVGLDMVDAANPQHWLSVRGKVVEITEEGALEHIHKLSKKYTGNDKYGFLRPGEVRVICKIATDRVIAQ